jgi:NMD protein affecting ribosome stability and mRNA decay
MPVIHQDRVGAQRDLTMRFVDRQFDDHEALPSPTICPRCHAHRERGQWRYDEQRYRALLTQPDMPTHLCPGCERIERRMYEGEVTARHDWSAVSKEEALNLINHEEARARASNPGARIAVVEDRGDELYILTTTQFLAKRIGRELEKAYRGVARVMHLPRERFTRVYWERT